MGICATGSHQSKQDVKQIKEIVRQLQWIPNCHSDNIKKFSISLINQNNLVSQYRVLMRVVLLELQKNQQKTLIQEQVSKVYKNLAEFQLQNEITGLTDQLVEISIFMLIYYHQQSQTEDRLIEWAVPEFFVPKIMFLKQRYQLGNQLNYNKNQLINYMMILKECMEFEQTYKDKHRQLNVHINQELCQTQVNNTPI